MSMHKIPLTDLERLGLEKHHLPIGNPSQLSDCFRLGMKFAIEHENSDKKELIHFLKIALGYIDINIVECHGDKCRLPNCISCFDEESAQDYVDHVATLYNQMSILISRIERKM